MAEKSVKEKMAEAEQALLKQYGKGGTGHPNMQKNGLSPDDCPVLQGTLLHVKNEGIDSIPSLTEEQRAELRRIVPKGEKRVVQRICASDGKTRFFVGTSDLHQCFYAPAARAEVRKERNRKRRAAKKAAEREELERLQEENAKLKQSKAKKTA